MIPRAKAGQGRAPVLLQNLEAELIDRLNAATRTASTGMHASRDHNQAANLSLDAHRQASVDYHVVSGSMEAKCYQALSVQGWVHALCYTCRGHFLTWASCWPTINYLDKLQGPTSGDSPNERHNNGTTACCRCLTHSSVVSQVMHPCCSASRHAWMQAWRMASGVLWTMSG